MTQIFPTSISDIRHLYPMSDIQYPTSARARARARARLGLGLYRARAGILDWREFSCSQGVLKVRDPSIPGQQDWREC